MMFIVGLGVLLTGILAANSVASISGAVILALCAVVNLSAKD